LIQKEEFDVIDWIAGDKGHYSSTLNEDNRDFITSFLDTGGKLLISGSNLGYDLYIKGDNQEKAFYLHNLKSICRHDAPDNLMGEIYELHTIDGTLFEGIAPVRIDDGTYGTYNVFNPDVVYTRGGGKVGIEYSGLESTTRGAAVYSDERGHMIYMNFPLETVFPEENRDKLFHRIISYFSGQSGLVINEPIPLEVEFSRNYPNPFNSETIIEFALSKKSPVEITIYNVLSQIVHAHNPGKLSRGVQQYTWNAAGMNSGVYYYQIIAGYRKFSGKLLHIK
jgi:hypothetical protein